MRRLMALLMTLVMLAGMLVACTPEQQLETPPGFDTRPSTEGRLPTTQPTTLPATDPTDPTDPTEPTEPEEQDFFTRYGQGLPEPD
jgi:hypothetical protein